MIKSHQIEGVIWCLGQELVPSPEGGEDKRRRGGVLADEMGMGKTIQLIGLFMLNPQRKTLLIVPPILLKQWSAEIRKFTGHIATMYYGKDRKKIDLVNPKVLVVITSYETVVRDVAVFKDVAWNRVVCDEAHHLRNPKTKIYSAVQEILSNVSTYLWFITGTPIHHSPKDIYSLYYLFGYSLAELTELKDKKGIAILRSRFLQRRHQKPDLPEKNEHKLSIEWKEARERDLAKDIHQTIPFLGFSGETAADAYSFWVKQKRPVLVSMIRAKQTCILSKMTETSYLSEMAVSPSEDVPFLARTMPVFETSTTTKLQEILRLLNYRRENGNGKVIFCHYRLEMAYLLEKLRDDSTKSWIGTWQDYKKIEYSFRSSILGESPILILQIQSGCEGLNLQDHFSEVYFVSPDWNPTLEEQAIARCYRIGQKKPVEVFRFSMDFVDTPENNFQRRNEVQKYRSLFDPLPFDLQRYISSFLPSSDSSSLENARKYSMDQYTFIHSEKKQSRITEFLEVIR
jgi:SNF2 family DNA or RNA helicase